MLVHSASLSLAAALLAPAMNVQASASEDQTGAQAVHPVAAAVATAASAPLHLHGTIASTDSGSDADAIYGAGPTGAVVAAHFVGDLEIVRTKAGEFIVASSATAPGFVFYDDGSTRLVEILHGDQKMRLGEVEHELMQLVDFAGMLQVLRKAEVRPDPRNELSGGERHRYKLDLPLEYLRPKRSAAPKRTLGRTIFGVAATVDVDPSDRSLVGFRVEVSRGFFIGGGTIIETTPGAGGRVVEAAVDEAVELESAVATLEPRERGTKTTYNFRRAPETKLSRRMQRALDRMRQNVEEVGRRR